MTAEDIEEAILRLPPAELAKFRAWFAEFEAAHIGLKSPPDVCVPEPTDHPEETSAVVVR